MKRKAGFLIKMILFVMLAGLAVLGLNRVMLSTSDVGLTDIPEGDQNDILILGPSTVTYGINPMNLWNDYGYTSYSLGTGSQSLGMSYFILREAVTKGSPELVILDCGRAYRDETAEKSSYLHYVTDSMPLLSANRIGMIRELGSRFSAKEQLSLYFPLISCHTRWDELTKTDFEKNEKAIAYGARVTSRVGYAGDYLPVTPVTDYAIGRTSRYYLERIIALCRENDIDLLLMTLPIGSTANNVSQSDYDMRVNAAYALEEFAAERGVPYINMFDQIRQAGLDPVTDSRDGLHLNDSGARKLTALVGAYLQEHYTLTDHRQEAGYESYQKDYEAYLDFYAEEMLQTANRMDVYVKQTAELRKDDRYLTVIMYSPGKDDPLHPFTDYEEAFSALGIDTSVTDPYFAVIRGSGAPFQKVKTESDEILPETEEFDYTDPVLDLAVSLNPEDQAVIVSQTNYIGTNCGFHIVVYDLKTRDLVDSLWVDTSLQSYYLMHEKQLNYR
jgi:hypothetical protein